MTIQELPLITYDRNNEHLGHMFAGLIEREPGRAFSFQSMLPDLNAGFSRAEKQLCETFVGSDDKICINRPAEDIISIDHLSDTYAPSLSFKTEGPFLHIDLHNCFVAPLAVPMYFYGLRILRNIYMVHDIPTKALPEMRWTDEGLFVTIPFTIAENSHVKNASLDTMVGDVVSPRQQEFYFCKPFTSTHPDADLGFECVSEFIPDAQTSYTAIHKTRIKIDALDALTRCTLVTDLFSKVYMQAFQLRQ